MVELCTINKYNNTNLKERPKKTELIGGKAKVSVGLKCHRRRTRIIQGILAAG
jgi:hypothetical protein